MVFILHPNVIAEWNHCKVLQHSLSSEFGCSHELIVLTRLYLNVSSDENLLSTCRPGLISSCWCVSLISADDFNQSGGKRQRHSNCSKSKLWIMGQTQSLSSELDGCYTISTENTFRRMLDFKIFFPLILHSYFFRSSPSFWLLLTWIHFSSFNPFQQPALKSHPQRAVPCRTSPRFYPEQVQFGAGAGKLGDCYSRGASFALCSCWRWGPDPTHCTLGYCLAFTPRVPLPATFITTRKLICHPERSSCAICSIRISHSPLTSLDF